MAEGGWFQLLGAALVGGVTVKMLDIVYQEIRRRLDHTRSAVRFVDEHLDPLLKAADELVGKLRALGESDFRGLKGVNPTISVLDNHDFSGLMYLFGRLWARIEVIRQRGLSVAITQDVRGKRLQSFMDCLESRRVRIVDRIAQRAVAEIVLVGAPSNGEVKSFVEFVNAFETDAVTRRWMHPLMLAISRTQHTFERQRLLQYATVVHALIDTLDPKHLVTRNRPATPNKLTKRSWRDLNYRVFHVYLPFVQNQQKYLGDPKKPRLSK